MQFSSLLKVYLLLIVLSADVYIVFTWLKPITVLSYALILVWVASQPKKMSSHAVGLMIAYLIFILYLSFIDLGRNGLVESLSLLISSLPMPIVFIAIASNSKRDELVFFYAKAYLAYNGLFAILQLAGFHYTAGELLSAVSFLGVDNGFDANIGGQGLRVSGASFSVIGFALHIGLIFLIFFFTKPRFGLYSAQERLFYILFLVLLSILTQTRSLLFILPLVILFVEIVHSRRSLLQKTSILIFSLMFAIVLLFAMMPIIEALFPRLLLGIEEDGSVVHRIQANVYAVVGVLSISPVFGVSESEQIAAMLRGYEKLGLFIGYYFIDEVTHHNQPAYFFRYYGAVGIVLFFNVYWRLLQLGKRTVQSGGVQLAVALLVFQFFYSLSHNNKIVSDYFFWILYAINMQVISGHAGKRNGFS